MSQTVESVLASIVERIQRFPELAGCTIAYVGSNQSRLLSAPYGSSGSTCTIVIETIKLADEDASALEKVAKTGASSPQSAEVVTRGSVIRAEATGAAINCTMFAISALGVMALGAATGGIGFLAVAAWVGSAAGALQCVNAVVRTGVAIRDHKILEQMDKDEAYSQFFFAVDAVGVATSLVALPKSVLGLWKAFSTRAAFAKRGLDIAKLKQLGREGRLRVVKEVVDEVANTAEGRKALADAMKSAQVTLTRSTLSFREAQRASRVLGQSTITQLRDAVQQVLTDAAGPGFSATPASATGTASGCVNWLINVIWPEDKTKAA